MTGDALEESLEADGAPEPRKKSATGPWIAIGVGLGCLLALTCLGGGTALVVVGLGMVTEQVEQELEDNAILREHLGTIEEFDIAWSRSSQEPGDVFVYEVRGSLGSGHVRCESLSHEDREEILWAELILPSGEVVELVRPHDPAEER